MSAIVTDLPFAILWRLRPDGQFGARQFGHRDAILKWIASRNDAEIAAVRALRVTRAANALPRAIALQNAILPASRSRR
jgi:hypothetical protein